MSNNKTEVVKEQEFPKILFVGNEIVVWDGLSLIIDTADAKQVSVSNLKFGKTIGFLPVYLALEDAIEDGYSPEKIVVINLAEKNQNTEKQNG